VCEERLIVPPSSMGDLLFVYGTLRSDPKNEMHRTLACFSAFVGDGRIRGDLYDLGSYPGVFLTDGCLGMVHGEVYGLSFQHALQTWRVLDNYEGCSPDSPEPHEYRRQRVRVFLDDGNEVEAWAYLLTSLPSGAVRVPGGDYLAWQKERR
jgi:gamma-glutamylcyclotransferase (GGCT)/AIG2-like uncharacterized protein YtfP